LEQALKERLSTGHFIGLSLILDILRMDGGKHDPGPISALALLCEKLD
jgi:hypothetical protein